MHKNNIHTGRYDLQSLIKANPDLGKFVSTNQYDKETINFHDASAVVELNRSLLKKHYRIDHWNIPRGYLCPPIPGRADYIHHISDLLSGGKSVPKGDSIRILDVGVGSNCIYPLIAHSLFGWSALGTDIDQVALKNARSIVDENNLSSVIHLKYQSDKESLLHDVVGKEDIFDVVICNPPFHESAAAARKANDRKNKNLRNTKSKLNFGGQSNELWYEGGEVAFIDMLIKESRIYSRSTYWYTTLVSKESNLPKILSFLNNEKPAEHRIVEMKQGNKTSRFLAWTYLPPKTRKIWEETRWRS